MGAQVINLFVIIAVGVIVADMVAHWQGTQALFNGIASIWSISVNGMLGNTPPPTAGTGTSKPVQVV